MVNKIKLLNLHFLCEKNFIDCFFMLSEVFDKSQENSAAFGRAIV